MPQAHDIISAARSATVWSLMVVSVFLGPVSVFAASPDTSPRSSSTPGLVPSDAAATGVCTGVFRPPRSR